MDANTLESLEFPAVLAELSSHTVTPYGKEKVLGITPSGSLEEVEEAFRAYSEVEVYLKTRGRLPVGDTPDIREYLRRIEPVGAYLHGIELLDVRSVLDTIHALKTLLNPAFEREFPRTASLIGAVTDESDLRKELGRILDDKGALRDDASGELYRIRKEMRDSRDRAKAIIEKMSVDEGVREFLQEDIVTVREDRYVLVVKAGKYTNIRGVVHGRSGSGASFFVEPFQIIELNNRFSVLRKEEKAEEVRILQDVARRISGRRDSILAGTGAIGALDMAQAKALFAKEVGGVVPGLKPSGEVKLSGSRHPLLVIKELRGSGKTVPVDITVGGATKVLVISGANTGGKTVALKALGLLTLMVQSAIPVPVSPESEAVVFGSIFSDIGDQQDIIESLSTFSAHIKRIREFLEMAGAGSLVLIDEIGAGTDPAEGGALALAAIESFRNKGAVVAVTTHLNLLKAYAQTHEEYCNASVEFDEGTLKPLYRLKYGMPGPSLGLSIAASLGIPGELVSRARGHLSEKEGAFIDSIRTLEKEKEDLRKVRERLEALEAERTRAVEKLRAGREDIVRKAREKVEEIVKGARERIREEVERIREERMASPGAASSAYSAVESAAKEALGRLGERKKVSRYVPSVGDRVVVAGSGAKGNVARLDGENRKAEILVGNMKVWAPWDKLSKTGREGERASSKGPLINADMEAGESVNVIGMRVEEALPVIEKFLDAAHASGRGRVVVIHGVGTGALAKAVHEYLGGSPVVKGFSPGAQGEGGAGVTVVELR